MAETFSLTSEAEVRSAPQGNFDRSIVDEVWHSTDQIAGNDSAIWRKDENGSTICRNHYGNQSSSYGWEIVESAAKGLQAIHFENL